ncbi:MAG TPA: calcium-binding protein, partial [Agitococcus sp.]|nr:calcium-binding protein [Agitococcus sp.]
MSQSANSSINFDLSNINMWNGGDATGFDLANVITANTGLFEHFAEDNLIGYKVDLSHHVQDTLAGIDYSYDYGLEVTAGLILKAKATLGELDLSYKIDAVNDLPTEVKSGDRFDIDTSKWTALSQLTSLGPSIDIQIGTTFTLNAYMRNLTMDFPAIDPVSLGTLFDASVSFSHDFINTEDDLDLTYSLPSPTSLVSISGELPNGLAGTSGEPATTQNALPNVVSQAQQEGYLLEANLDLIELAKLFVPAGKAIPDVSKDLYIDAGSGNWIPKAYDPDSPEGLPVEIDSDGDGSIDEDKNKNIITLNYLLLDAQLKGGFKAFQEFTFKPQAVEIRMEMKVDGQVVEVQTGKLGDIFGFTAPEAGYGNIEITPYYTLKGQIENKTGVIADMRLELSAFDFGATFENVTIGGQTFNPDIKFDLFGEDKALIDVALPDGGLQSDPWIWYNKTFDVNSATLVGDTVGLVYGDYFASSNVQSISYAGDAFDNEIKGHNNHDFLEGLGGNDTIRGYSGMDLIFAGDGQDVVYAGADDDTVDGNAGNDFLYGGKGYDTLYGDAHNNDSETGDDFLSGDEGNDTLYGGNGHDYLDGGTGYDELHGGAGDDLLTSNDGDALYGEAGNDTYHLGRGNYVLGDTQALGESWENNRYVFHATGVSYENTRFYRDGDSLQVVFSDYGFNQLGSMTIASYGNQKVAEGLFIYNTDGSPNNNNYVGGFNLATVWSVISSEDDIPEKSLAVAGRFSVLPSEAGSIGIGAPRPLVSEGDDVIDGTTGDDVINALGGNDWINVRRGNDTVYGGEGNDSISLMVDGNDVVDGGLGVDSLSLSLGELNHYGVAGIWWLGIDATGQTITPVESITAFDTIDTYVKTAITNTLTVYGNYSFSYSPNIANVTFNAIENLSVSASTIAET